MFHPEGPGSTGTYLVHATSIRGSDYRAKAKTPPDLRFARYKVQEQTTGSNRISVTFASSTGFMVHFRATSGIKGVRTSS